MEGHRTLAFILLLLQAGFGLVMGSTLLLLGILAFRQGLVLGVVTLGTAFAVIVLAAGVKRGWRLARYFTIGFEALVFIGAMLALVIKPDLLLLITNVALPAIITALLVFRWEQPTNSLNETEFRAG